MHRAPKWRSQLRTRQRARTTLNRPWFEPRHQHAGGVPAPPTRDDATPPTTGGPSNDEIPEAPETAAASRGIRAVKP